MPPSAAPEWERVGCSFEMIATSAPASCAAMAARMPAQPPPITRTSCSPITADDASGSRVSTASVVARYEGLSPWRRARASFRSSSTRRSRSSRKRRLRSICSSYHLGCFFFSIVLLLEKFGWKQRCHGCREPARLDLGSRGRDLGGRVRGELLLEVVAEHPREIARLPVVRLGVAPRVARRE